MIIDLISYIRFLLGLMFAAEKPIMFGDAAAQRIKRAVLKVERMPFPLDKTPSKYPIITGGGAQYVGVVGNGGITARTNTSAGFGTVFTWNFNVNTGQFTNSNTSLTCYNISSTTGGITNGAWVGYSYRTTSNIPVIDMVDCGN